MERELWRILSREITAVDRCLSRGQYTHSVGRIVRVYLWAVLNDRPVYWACRRENWRGVRAPRVLPDQSRMSRRLRQDDARAFLVELSRRLRPTLQPELLKMMDGKPLPVSRHSADPDAAFGRGAGGLDNGYKLHAIYAASGVLMTWRVYPMNLDERTVAHELIGDLQDEGYLLADANYDAMAVYDTAWAHGHQLLAPRKRPYTGLGRRRHSPRRLRAIDLLEGPGRFGRSLFSLRRRIETKFGNLTSFGGGLTHLPPWVRTLPRVRLYVAAKLLIRDAKTSLAGTAAA